MGLDFIQGYQEYMGLNESKIIFLCNHSTLQLQATLCLSCT